MTGVSDEEPGLQQWRKAAEPRIRLLIGAAKEAARAVSGGSGTLAAGGQHLEDVVAVPADWLVANPCPDRRVGEHLDSLVSGALRMPMELVLASVEPTGPEMEQAKTGFIDIAGGLEALLVDLAGRDHFANPRSAQPGRNDPCPCGSGSKYKRCHGANAANG
jgi:hypothetical protein